MSAKIFHKLMSVDDAIREVLAKLKPSPRGVEIVKLEDAVYRVLATDIYAPLDYPPFDRSEVDGYAVLSHAVSKATELNPVELKVAGKVSPGEYPENLFCDEKSAVQVSTGSAVPANCDAVIMEEYTERREDTVRIYRSVAPGEGVSTTGSDVSAGDLVLPHGVLIKHKEIAVLAGLGFHEIPVYVKPRIAVYSTGAEVVEPGKHLALGEVYDVNGYLITAFLRELGANAEYKGILPDDYTVIKNTIERDLDYYDVIVTSGGTSAGVADTVYRVFESLGDVIVHGLKAKPGKPTVIAISGKKLLMGLPGFPLSAYMILVRVVKPIISALTGLRYYEKPLFVRFPFKLRKNIGITWLLPSIILSSNGSYVAYPVSFSSGSIYAITYSDGFVELSEEKEVVEGDELVPFYSFTELADVDKLVIIGSNDPLLEFILKKTGLVYASKVLNVGSMGGWRAVERGEADIAPTHLLDPDTGKYNTPFLSKFKLENKAVVVRGYSRLIGFIVAKGNPKNIKGFECFFRSDVRIVNRNKGSGIRTLIDMNLVRIAREKGLNPDSIPRLIKGYTYEVKTHTAVGYAVKTGKADVGVAVGYVSEMYDLDFIPVGWEEYDFVVLKSRLGKPLVEDFIKFLRGGISVDDFKYAKYYRIPENAGTIIA
ncbi:MAG: molybdopterin biosynthesis protein [Desulfurococcaceae archaeon]